MSHRWCYWWVVYGATDESSTMLLTLTSNTQCRCHRTRVRSWILRWGMLWIGECSTLHIAPLLLSSTSSPLTPQPPQKLLSELLHCDIWAIWLPCRQSWSLQHLPFLSIHSLFSCWRAGIPADDRTIVVTMTTVQLLPWRPYNGCSHQHNHRPWIEHPCHTDCITMTHHYRPGWFWLTLRMPGLGAPLKNYLIEPGLHPSNASITCRIRHVSPCAPCTRSIYRSINQSIDQYLSLNLSLSHTHTLSLSLVIHFSLSLSYYNMMMILIQTNMIVTSQHLHISQIHALAPVCLTKQITSNNRRCNLTNPNKSHQTTTAYAT